MMGRWIATLALAAACSSGMDDTASYGVTGTLTANTPDGRTVSATMTGHKAFAYDANGRLLLYVSSSSDATCDDVAHYLSEGPTTEPTPYFPAGSCNLVVPLDDYSGSFSGDRAANDTGVDAVGGSISVSCTMGDGSWEPSSSGYTWSGDWWQGGPAAWSLDIDGNKSDGYTASIWLDSFIGTFTYEVTNPGDASKPADGTLSGLVKAESCKALTSATVW